MNLAKYRNNIKETYPSVSENDTTLIIAEVLNIPRTEIFLDQERIVTKAEMAKMDMLLFQRAENEPLQYLLGKAHFRNIELEVGPGVLIPRPETEILVNEALKHITGIESPKVCDLGTGSGAIALSIASEIEDSSVIGIDISRDALVYAERNKVKNKIGNADFILGNLFSPFEMSPEKRKFNAITANLPYISDFLFKMLPDEIKDFEPETALLAGDDGLEIIKKAAEHAKEYLSPGGAVFFEFSPEQENTMMQILTANNYSSPEIINDLTGRARIAVGYNDN